MAGQQTPGICMSLPSSIKMTSMLLHLAFKNGLWRIELRSSCLLAQHMHYQTSQLPRTQYYFLDSLTLVK